MIIFTPIAPEYFQSIIGLGPLAFTKQVFVYNLLSYDVRYPKLTALIPDGSRVSEYAYRNDDTEEFEKEFFSYLDKDEGAFIAIMNIMLKEFQDGSNLTIIETVTNSSYCDSIVSSLIKYLYTRYGIRPIIVQETEDIENIRIENSIFSPNGLLLMDHDITALNVICPEMFADQQISEGGCTYV